MKQYQQVIEAMKNNGGFATLGWLNQNVDVKEWQSKTPYASIRRIVQDKRYFFKIKPGLWALNEFEKKILEKFQLNNTEKNEEIFNHTYFQGLLIEIGNIKSSDTYVAPQDKNKLFLDKKLSSITTLGSIHNFTYPEVIQKAKNIDVIWFNERKFPQSFFEVEHSTDFTNSLIKFNELQDFNCRFHIISPSGRKKEFISKLKQYTFREIQNRVEFWDYEFVAGYHTKLLETDYLEKNHQS